MQACRNKTHKASHEQPIMYRDLHATQPRIMRIHEGGKGSGFIPQNAAKQK